MVLPFTRFVQSACAVLLFLPGIAWAQQETAARPSTGYNVFVRGTLLGREVVTVSRDQEGTTITTQGRLSPPLNVTLRNAEFKYRPDWTPVSFVLDATTSAGNMSLRTTFASTAASSQGTLGTQPVSMTHMIVPKTIVHANGVFASYVALARRLAENSEEGAEFRVYVVTQREIGILVKAIHRERMQIGTSMLDVRRFELVYRNPAGDLLTNLTVADDGTLISVNIPSESIDLVRDDLASSTSRTTVYSNPGDEAVIIPATGFNLGATLTRPGKTGGAGRPARLPAVVLLAGAGMGDRDGFIQGVPILTQTAGAIADAGMMAVRFDKRGNGQSGGRSESATLSDLAEDARVVVRWLERRPDVDPKRIAILGHGEGAWVAMLAASREKKIAGLVSIAGASVTGAELVLEQQRQELDQLGLSSEEREKRIAQQKQIQSAVLTGKGWEDVRDDVRKGADTPWFQSLLAFDPAKVLEDVRQPLLLVHGQLDREIPVAHSERLSALADKNSDSKSIEAVVVVGVNHLLVPAVTGEKSEYGTLPDRHVSKNVTMAVTNWLTKTFAATR
jgi:pimeloyl-ACP methyl ester carboxylesterase